MPSKHYYGDTGRPMGLGGRSGTKRERQLRAQAKAAAVDAPHGNALQGAVTPGKVIPAGTAKPITFAELQVVYEGAGDVIADVTYDTGRKVLTAVRGFTSAGFIPIVGTILGGNTQLMQSGAAGNTVYSYPLPLTEDGEKVIIPPVLEVEDWTEFDLPSTYKVGDTLPTLPPGLCYVKLERPSSFGAYSWDAAFPTTARVRSSGDPNLIQAECVHNVSKRDINLIFDRNILVSAGIQSAAIRNDSGGVFEVTYTFSASGNIGTVTTELDLAYDVNYTIEIPAGAFVTSGAAPNILSAAIQANVIMKGASHSVLIAYNRHSYQTFYAGDLVLMANLQDTIIDGNNVIRSVPDIIGNMSNLRSPHTHAFGRYDYGGSAAGAAQIGG